MHSEVVVVVEGGLTVLAEHFGVLFGRDELNHVVLRPVASPWHSAEVMGAVTFDDGRAQGDTT